LARFAAAHPKTQDGAMALVAAALVDREERRFEQAISRLRQAQPRLPLLADYIAFHLASAQYDIGNFAAAIEALAPVWKSQPPSPLEGDAALLAARAYKDLGKAAEGTRVLREHYGAVPQPAGDALLAECALSAGNRAQAAHFYQRVFYDYPNSPEAERAAKELKALETQLGPLYPPPTAQMMLRRANRLADARQYTAARAAYTEIAPKLAGLEQDLARVRIGEMDYRLYKNAPALSYLRNLNPASAEADAERLYYVLECARRLDREREMSEALDALAAKHPKSVWRMRALISLGNHYLVRNNAGRYIPLYRACAEDFAGEPRADYCHWKVAWNAYMRRQADAPALLREHITKYPGSTQASAALYFLGRLAELAERHGEAKAFFSAVQQRFPNHFYAGEAARRLDEAAISAAAPDPETARFVSSLALPETRRGVSFDPAPATKLRIERARLLQRAGLEPAAERELRFGVRSEKQPEVLAVQLAVTGAKYEEPHRALQLLKSLAPDYLRLDLDTAPDAFWRILFPLPWRSILERHSRERGLDPFTVAGLIRQESEFNPRAVSPARAYGLTQIMPATGRQLLKVSRSRFRPTVLFDPELNLRLGTTYLKRQLHAYSGRWECALAAYNAGPSRVKEWLTWGDYRERAEFIENIPFSETRSYVTAVLRNADLYRRIYAKTPATVADSKVSAPAAKPATTVKKSTTSKKPTTSKKAAASSKKAASKKAPARKKTQ
jgi:soluble lytic murein transglycosylase